MKAFSLLAAFVQPLVSAHAQTAAPAAKSTPPPKPVPPRTAAAKAPAGRIRLDYIPPKNADSGTRIDGDGGSRSGGVKQPSVSVLVPDHTALTTQAQPTLFWYQSGPSNSRFELTIVEPKKPKPLLRVGTDKADQPGIHRILLAKHNLTLAPGITYRWTVALVSDPANRSQDVIASGTIRRTAPDAQLSTALAAAHGLDKAALYARNSYWYDALEAVTDEVNASPKLREIRLQRAAFLDQGGLKTVAAAERR